MAKRKEAQKLLSLDSLGPGEKSRLIDCELLDLSNVSTLAITARMTHHPSATTPARVYLLSSPDGAVFDTTPYSYFDMELDAGNEVQVTKEAITCALYLKVQVENRDADYPITDIDIYAIKGFEEEK
jgi:hypothetical protein